MSDAINVFNNVSNIDVSPQFNSYSKIIIHVDDETVIEVGNNSGRTLEIDNPFGTQAMASNLLAALQAQGFRYQPYNADGVILDPAAEIGDALSATQVYGGIYKRSRSFGKLMKANVGAPEDEEIDHEYKFETQQEREFKRETSEIKASIILTNEAITAEVTRATSAESGLSSRITQTANEINANVVKKTGGSTSSFGWTLTDSSWSVSANSSEVFKIDRNGASVTGTIRATSGAIGGFTIGNSAIYNGMNNLSSADQGVYIGTDGISVGGGSFRVTASGAVSAANMTLTGTLNIGGETITAAALRSGAQSAYNNGGNWTSAYNSTSAGGFCYTGATNGNSALNKVNNLIAGNITATTLKTNGLQCTSLRIGANVVKTTTISPGYTYNNVLYLAGNY